MITNITGIQQIGIGVTDVYEAWKFYRKAFGVDIPMLDDDSSAELMLPYTGGQPQKRHAVLALNIRGGGGFEIWQYSGRKPQMPVFRIRPGDLGINMAKVRCRNAENTFKHLKNTGINIPAKIISDQPYSSFFYCIDPYGNVFQLVEDSYVFINTSFPTGGIMGTMIGVSDIDKSLGFYSGLLGYNKILYDRTGSFDDLDKIDESPQKYRRVLLSYDYRRMGAFSQLLGPSQIELLQVLDRNPKKIYENRLWGDPGFIHLCFDVYQMDEVISQCNNSGFPVTVDSSEKFEMGDAAGRFTYIEDPDGTLIEFVETFKIPVIRKIGWFLDLRKRNNQKPLPRLMLHALRFNRVMK
ncbi:MAG: VOC family protein [Bacteroidia bacterium]|nr:VOC family protein [Bacteroidia bacterium]